MLLALTKSNIVAVSQELQNEKWKTQKLEGRLQDQTVEVLAQRFSKFKVTERSMACKNEQERGTLDWCRHIIHTKMAPIEFRPHGAAALLPSGGLGVNGGAGTPVSFGPAVPLHVSMNPAMTEESLSPDRPSVIASLHQSVAAIIDIDILDT